jgi:hypothetical protein
VDLSKLSLSDRIIVASGILLFIAYFLPWFDVSVDSGITGVGDFSESANGSDVDFIWSTLPMLIGLVMAGVIIASKLFDVKLPELPVTWGQAHLGLGALAAFLVVLKLLMGEDAPAAAEAFGVDISRAFGLFLAALAAIGLAVGGWLMFKEGDEPATTNDTGTAPF